MDIKNHTVWILGAGFSHSLGGPLLRDLFRLVVPERWGAYCVHEQHREIWNQIVKINKLYKLGGPEGERYWQDPEHFVDSIQSISESDNDYAKKHLRIMADKAGCRNSSIPQLADAAARALVAECSIFLRGATPEGSERWKPYIAWCRRLHDEVKEQSIKHTIVSFNYDRVLETMEDTYSWMNFDYIVLDAKDSKNETVKIPYLKLHGSVDWKRILNESTDKSEKSYQIVRGTNESAIELNSDKRVIGVPGPSKRKLIGGLLEPLWKETEQALHDATRVYFIGYRFPESDAESRERLLTALCNNKKRVLLVDTVLGWNVNDVYTTRLKCLLDWAILRHSLSKERVNITVHPLFAEDFLALHAMEKTLKLSKK